MAELGYHVHPVRIQQYQTSSGQLKKRPVGLPKGWQLKGLTDSDAIRARFAEIGATGYMVACGPSGLTVVDLDVKGDGEANWAAAGGAAHAAFEVRTWSGGRHLYFRSAGACNTSGRPPGVDIRGVDGGVFGPGSVVLRPDGTVAGEYSILAGSAVRSGLTPEPANLAQIVGVVHRSLGKVSGEGHTNYDDFFTPSKRYTVSTALAKCREQVAKIGALSGAPGTGCRRVINDAAYTLGGVIGSGAEIGTYEQARSALLGACATVWGAADDEDERWIDAGLADGIAKPLIVVPDPERANPLVVNDVKPCQSFVSMLLDSNDLDSLPDPQSLIERWLYRDTTARLIGQAGSYKSFVALDMACCVAAGRPWHGHEVTQTPVLYVVGESSLSDYKRRLAAWCEHNKVDRAALKGRITFTTGPVQIGSELWTELAAWTTANGVGFIIGDTQAKMSVGSKENDNDAQGVVFAHLDALRQATGGTLMLLHHTGHPGGEAGERGRGASIWRGSVDTELLLTKTGEYRATLRNDRQKVAPSGREVGVAMVPTAQSLAVRIETTVAPSLRTQWLTGQVAAGVRFEGTNKLADAAREAGFTVNNNAKKDLFNTYEKLVAENDRPSSTCPFADNQTSGLR